MDVQFVRIKINQPVPPGAPVVSIIVGQEGFAAVLGKHGTGPGGAGWIESELMPVIAALDAAKAELLRVSLSGNGPFRRSSSDVVFVYFNSDDHWDPSWGQWNWLRRSGAPLPGKRGKEGWRMPASPSQPDK